MGRWINFPTLKICDQLKLNPTPNVRAKAVKVNFLWRTYTVRTSLLDIDKSNKHNSNSVEKYVMLPVYVNDLN